MQPSYPDITRGKRVVHNLYGRGRVEIVHRNERQAGVVFDGEKARRRVWLQHLAAEPTAMPANRPELTVVR